MGIRVSIICKTGRLFVAQAVLLALAFTFAGQEVEASSSCVHDGSSRRIIYIGDSISAADFGRVLTETLAEKTGATVRRFAVAGSAANHWNRSDNAFIRKLHINAYCDGMGNKTGALPDDFPVFSELMNEGALPRAVVIALGTNDAGWNCKTRDAGRQTADVRKLVSQLGGAVPCIWVGPPKHSQGVIHKTCGESYDVFLENMKIAVSARCTYIDSRELSAVLPRKAQAFKDCRRQGGEALTPDSGDGVHPGRAQAESWGRCAALAVAEALKTADSSALRDGLKQHDTRPKSAQ